MRVNQKEKGTSGGGTLHGGGTSRDQEEAAEQQQGLRNIFAIRGREISPVNLPQIMHTLGGKTRGHGGSGKIFMGEREEEMGN